MKSPKISVIVPVFNRENTITTCIEGISNTDYANYEIIIIDDGSTDNSLQICHQLAEKNSRIRVFHQQNAGVSSARNLGIRNATGDYLTFADSDDTLCPNALEIIASNIIDNIDLLIYPMSGILIDQLHEIQTPEISGINTSIITGNRQVIEWVFSKYIPMHGNYYSVVIKIFSTKIIRENGIHFRPDVTLGEDQIFVCEYLKHVQSLAYVDQPLYYVLMWPLNLRPTGLGNKLRSPEDFIYNQIQNYHSLKALHEHCHLDSVLQYANDYILDRPVTRILFRHLCVGNKSRSSISEIIAFTAEKIKPIIEQEREGIPRQKNKHVRRILQLIISGYVRTAVWYAFLIINKGSVYRTLKRLLRAK